jgi:hypothetical protein
MGVYASRIVQCVYTVLNLSPLAAHLHKPVTLRDKGMVLNLLRENMAIDYLKGQ